MCRYNGRLGLGTYFLDAVCGLVFASPNPSQVKRGIELVDNDKGFVHFFKGRELLSHTFY